MNRYIFIIHNYFKVFLLIYNFQNALEEDIFIKIRIKLKPLMLTVMQIHSFISLFANY
jgi:hypothetical protein